MCIARCLYSYRDDSPDNVGTTTAQECKTSTSGWSTLLKGLCLSSQIFPEFSHKVNSKIIVIYWSGTLCLVFPSCFESVACSRWSLCSRLPFPKRQPDSALNPGISCTPFIGYSWGLFGVDLVCQKKVCRAFIFILLIHSPRTRTKNRRFRLIALSLIWFLWDVKEPTPLFEKSRGRGPRWCVQP